MISRMMRGCKVQGLYGANQLTRADEAVLQGTERATLQHFYINPMQCLYSRAGGDERSPQRLGQCGEGLRPLRRLRPSLSSFLPSQQLSCTPPRPIRHRKHGR